MTPAIRRVHIAWYGGEPLIRRDVIEALSDRVIAHCRQHGLGYDAMIVTNGSLLDVDVARMLVARGVRGAQVTLDGPAGHHDARRHLHSKKGTFTRIVDNLKAVVAAVPELTLSVRVNIDDRNREDIEGLIDWIAEEGHCRASSRRARRAQVHDTCRPRALWSCPRSSIVVHELTLLRGPPSVLVLDTSTKFTLRTA